MFSDGNHIVIRQTVFAAAIAGMSLIGSALGAAAQGKDVVRETHGSWEVRCLEGTNNCALAQIGSTADGKRALLVTIQRLKGAKTQDGKAILAAMTVQAPLGILIPYGIRIKIDSDQEVPLPVTRCVQNGCVSQAPMLDEAVNKMKRGANAGFSFVLQDQVKVNISLSGFTKAYNSIEPVQAQN